MKRRPRRPKKIPLEESRQTAGRLPTTTPTQRPSPEKRATRRKKFQRATGYGAVSVFQVSHRAQVFPLERKFKSAEAADAFYGQRAHRADEKNAARPARNWVATWLKNKNQVSSELSLDVVGFRHSLEG
jgi:hypothetical protein